MVHVRPQIRLRCHFPAFLIKHHHGKGSMTTYFDPMTSSKTTDYRLAVFSRSQVDSSDGVKELETAIARFQAILDDDDRKKLQQLKTTSHDPQSIVLFTAELDRLDRNRRGKSVATRLSSFLQIIEQYTPIIDTFIQSNPDITALIWGSIKLTFTVWNHCMIYKRFANNVYSS